MVTVPLADTLPAQDKVGLVNETVPAAGHGVVVVGGVVQHAGQRVGEACPGVRAGAGVGDGDGVRHRAAGHRQPAAAVWVNVSVDAPTTVTVAAHAHRPAGRQLLPGVAEVTVLARDRLPVSGLFTVTE